ncbi:hypothetical protein OTU49_009664, partial [Cherax quadricarinatus]
FIQRIVFFLVMLNTRTRQGLPDHLKDPYTTGLPGYPEYLYKLGLHDHLKDPYTTGLPGYPEYLYKSGLHDHLKDPYTTGLPGHPEYSFKTGLPKNQTLEINITSLLH